MKTPRLLLVFVIGTILAIGALAQENSAPAFEGKTTTLLRPEVYREWVFVGSSLGLSYSNNASNIYHNVYIKPSSYREYMKTGKFPEGTMMALELFTSETKKEPGLQGSYEKDFVALEFSVKDSTRFEGGWGYYGFSERGTLKAKAEPFPQSNCWSCHHEKAATDHVFTQFYPVLKR
jgi:hypothetical protein